MKRSTPPVHRLWAPRVNFDLSPYLKVRAHHARIAARPSVVAALQAEGPIPG
jgi:glutathione S-transferase